MSAFALRKRLIKEQEEASSASHLEPARAVRDASPGLRAAAADSTPSKRKRQKRARVDAPAATSTPGTPGLPSEESVSIDQAVQDIALQPLATTADAEILDDDDLSPVEAPHSGSVIQFSNFKPSRINYQSKKNGVVVLKLSEGEVCSDPSTELGSMPFVDNDSA